jgi:hypothetical protein
MAKSLRSGTYPTWSGFLFVGLTLVSVGVGCGMFEIRPPTPPGGEPTCTARNASPASPESVLFNFAQSFPCQEAALGQFEGTLAEGFHLDLDDQDAIDIGTGVDSLSKAQTAEGQRLRSIEASTDSFAFAFEFGEESESGRTDQTAYYLDIPYTLRIGQSQGDSLIVTKTIAGTSDVFLALGLASQWFITRWVDQRGDSTSLGRWYGDKVGSSQAAQSP